MSSNLYQNMNNFFIITELLGIAFYTCEDFFPT